MCGAAPHEVSPLRTGGNSAPWALPHTPVSWHGTCRPFLPGALSASGSERPPVSGSSAQAVGGCNIGLMSLPLKESLGHIQAKATDPGRHETHPCTNLHASSDVRTVYSWSLPNDQKCGKGHSETHK